MKLLIAILLSCAVTLVAVAPAEAMKYKKDAAKVGKECLDKFENSVWKIDPDEPAPPLTAQQAAASLRRLRKLAESGNATLAKVQNIAGAVQVGATSDDYGAGCPNDGAGCTEYFALSIAGVTPSTQITQIQAMAVCRNSGKGLPDNATWTAGALGTPDPGAADNETTECNVGSTFVVADTGSRADCVSDVGAYDMIGNVWEWLGGNWVPRSTGCTGSWSFAGGDFQCLAGAATTGEPGALIRGGVFFDGTNAGVFTVAGVLRPSDASFDWGFRCVR